MSFWLRLRDKITGRFTSGTAPKPRGGVRQTYIEPVEKK